jgi:gliding motility-associated-like protein
MWYVLSATDANGCVGVDSVLVTPFFPVYVPNCITPDGDGINDFFFVVGERIDHYHLQIFDRWGMLIFESFNQSEPWNGGIKGYYVQNDVYTWKLQYKSLKGNEELSGHVTVVR